MEEKAVRGVPWTVLSYGATKLVTVGTTLVLARLLEPADFGLFALALLAINALAMFNDLGLGGTLVLRQELTPRDQGTVLTVMAATAALLAVLLAATSGPVADLFDEPRLADILLALSPLVFLGGINWFHEALLQRQLEFRKRFVALGSQSVSYAATALALAAIADAGVWSLVGGQLVGMVVYLVVLLRVVPYRVRPAFEPAVARLALETGGGFLVQRVCGFLQENADFLAVGKSLGPRQLGYYSMGYRLSELPYWGIADPVAKVTFPGFARMRVRGEDVRPAFESALRLVALVACPLAIVLSAAADPFTRAVLGEAWVPMIAPLAVLGIWGAFRPVQATMGWLLNSVGEAAVMGLVSIVTLLVLVPLLFVAADAGGITGVAWVMLGDVLVSICVLTVLARGRAGVRPAALWRALRPVLAGCAAAWVAGRLVAGIDVAPFLALACSATAALLVYVGAVALVEPSLLRGVAGQLRRFAAPSGDGGGLDGPGEPEARARRTPEDVGPLA